QVGVQVGDGEAAADAVPGVGRRAGQVDGAGSVFGDVGLFGGADGLYLGLTRSAGAAGEYGEKKGQQESEKGHRRVVVGWNGLSGCARPRSRQRAEQV